MKIDSLSHALAAFAEALVVERRVLVVGDPALGLQDLLVELGARHVHLYVPGGGFERAELEGRSPASVTVKPLPDGDFDVRDAAFDFAIVPDLAAIEDPAALLARLRRVVGPEGAVLCAAENREDAGATSRARTIDYYALYDLVSLQFAHVRMIAAMPFFGVTLAELGQDEVEAAVRVDTQLAGERGSPEAFAALASQSDVALDAYAVVELEAPPPSEPAPRAETDAALAQAKLRAQYLEGQVQELAEARAARARAEEEARRALEALDVERERARRLERDVDSLASQAASRAQKPPARDDARETELAEQLAQAQIRAAALEEGVDLAEKTIVLQRERIAELEARLLEAEESLAARAAEKEPVDDVGALEGKLRERADKLAELEAEVARREKMVRELVARLALAEPGQAPDLEKKLDDLAILAARQESELEARGWRIAELERVAGRLEEPRA